MECDRDERDRACGRGSRDRKTFGRTTALDGFDLEVRRGAVCGLLGPNGAGKTTAVRILTTLLRPDGGTARVAGFDVTLEAPAVRHQIGLVGQTAAVDEVLTGRQNLVMFGRLYHLGTRQARLRADDLLELFDLADTGDKAVKVYSGGMRRRLDLAASLILSPAVLFVDEPTTGLDPRGRNEVWSTIRDLVRNGTTVVLTTQYLDEADQLADRICVIDRGRVVAEGTPGQLKSQVGGDRVEVIVRHRGQLEQAALLVRRATGAEVHVDVDRRSLSALVDDRIEALTRANLALREAGIELEDLAIRRPTLDEVFLQLTGHAAEAETIDVADVETGRMAA
jgi:ABC-2 type transport system ATP-binding protein